MWDERGTWAHPLGTDRLGRDMLARIMYGARVSLAVGVLTVLLASAVGAAVGLVAGYYGGRVDAALMRITDATLSFPVILLALILAVTVGPSFFNVVIAIAVILWARYARVIRGQVLTLMQLDFIAQARIAGAGAWRIITRHLVPNTLNTLVVLVTLQVGYVIIVEASLSFLGAGIPPPTPGLGLDDRRGPRLRDERLVGVVPARPRHHAGRAGLQPARRLAARHPRPQAAPALSAVSAVVATVIDVRDLQTHIVTRWGTIKAVDGVSFTVAEGETLGIVGESGSGKSMTCLSIVRLVPRAGGPHRRRSGPPRRRGPPDQERGRDAADPRPQGRHDPAGPDELAQPGVLRRHAGARARRHVPRPARAARSPGGRRSCWPRCASPHRARGCAPFPTSSRAACASVSSGAMAIAAPPRLLIADEPTTSLDLTIQTQYLGLLKELQERHRLAMIFVTHDLGIVARICDRVAVMYGGRIVEIGPVRRIFKSPAHPYTKALLDAIPRLGARRDRLTTIEGQPPDLVALPPGCAFAPRCPARDRTLPPRVAARDRRGARARHAVLAPWPRLRPIA